MGKRQLELDSYKESTINLRKEQLHFQNMIDQISKSIKDFSNKEEASNSYLVSLCHFLSVKGAAIYEWNELRKYFSCVSVTGLYFPLNMVS